MKTHYAMTVMEIFPTHLMTDPKLIVPFQIYLLMKTILFFVLEIYLLMWEPAQETVVCTLNLLIDTNFSFDAHVLGAQGKAKFSLPQDFP